MRLTPSRCGLAPRSSPQVHGDYSAEVGDKIERPVEDIPGAAAEEPAQA